VLDEEAGGDERLAYLAAEVGVRSVLCAPIFVRGRPAASFCVAHREVGGLFGAEEVRLAQFIATLAGAALENAEGFAEVEALSRTLERRVAERTAQLAASNAQLDANLRRIQAVLESLSDGVVACDAEGRLNLFNRAAREFHGRGEEPVGPEQWAERYDLLTTGGELMPMERIPLLRALHGEEVRDFEMVVAPKEGRRRTLLASGQRVVDAGGTPLGAVVALHDVTERKQAERALEDAMRRLESILEAAGEGICGIDAEGGITYANPAAARLTGRSVADLVGLTLDDLLQPPGLPADALPMSAENVAAVFQRRDGSSFPVELTYTGVPGPRGAGTGVLLFRDVSERRALEQMKTEFVALASHELRTPLTSVLGYVEAALENASSEDWAQRRLLQVAQRNARRLAKLVGDVIVVAQADAGRFPLELGQVSLTSLAEECVEAARTVAEAAGITVTLNAQATPPVEGDRARLAQVLDNLVANALKFTPRGGRVSVGVSVTESHVVLDVTDTGIGIAADEQERLFTRFFRASGAVAAAIPGTGLGLAISKMIVEAHGGSVEVDSVEGVGSTFRVRLSIDPVAGAGSDVPTLARSGVAPLPS
jgi:PAS domain S-box-containing protein